MISLDKKYKTRDGREVRIYATDAGGDYPVHGAMTCAGGWRAMEWASDGHNPNAAYSLIEVKPERKVWVNLYGEPFQGFAYSTREHADKAAASDRIACIEVTFREGDGL